MSDYPRGFRTFSMGEVRAVAHREGSSADAVVRRSAVARTRPPKRAPLSAALAEPFLSRVRARSDNLAHWPLNDFLWPLIAAGSQ